VIDDKNQNLGVLSREQALNLARERGLDLIEVSPLAKPPVARIMDFSKWRYEQEKRLKKQRVAQRGKEMKQVQVSLREARHDLEMKAKRADDFLKAGHRVEILLTLRGREKGMRDWAREKLREFLKMISIAHKITLEPKPGQRGILTQIAKQ